MLRTIGNEAIDVTADWVEERFRMMEEETGKEIDDESVREFLSDLDVAWLCADDMRNEAEYYRELMADNFEDGQIRYEILSTFSTDDFWDMLHNNSDLISGTHTRIFDVTALENYIDYALPVTLEWKTYQGNIDIWTKELPGKAVLSINIEPDFLCGFDTINELLEDVKKQISTRICNPVTNLQDVIDAVDMRVDSLFDSDGQRIYGADEFPVEV